MRFVHLIPLAALALATAPLSALAGEGCGTMSDFDVVTHIFDASDADGSGTLSPEEYAAAGLERYGVSFDEYDADGDGETSLDEYRDLYERYHRAEGEIEA